MRVECRLFPLSSTAGGPHSFQLCCATHNPQGTLSLPSSPPLRRWVPCIFVPFPVPWDYQEVGGGVTGGGGGITLPRLILDSQLPSASRPWDLEGGRGTCVHFGSALGAS